jgi:hypothetical protein
MYFLQMPNGKVMTMLARQPAKTRLRKKSDGSFYVKILSIPSDRRAIRDKKIEASMRRGMGEDAKYSKSNQQQKALELERQSVILVREIEDANTSDQEVAKPSAVLVHMHYRSRVWQIFVVLLFLRVWQPPWTRTKSRSTRFPRLHPPSLPRLPYSSRLPPTTIS